ncbi:MAG: DUF58 domain-containing protein [Planctomycetota bacterium]
MAKLKGLHLRARHIVEGYVAGLHRSPYHGFSIEFAEHREYTPGDDLRYVDWKVFGRTDKFYLKQYDDETNLICHLVVDVSESMTYRGPNAALSKFEYAQATAAALAWLVLQQQDAAGLVTFDQRIRSNLRASSSPSHLRQILQTLEAAPLEAETAAGPIFHELAQRLKKRSLVVILSDLFDDVDSMITGLKHFHHRRHDVLVFHVLDPVELDFSFSRPTIFQGLERGPRVTADPRSLRGAYVKEIEAHVRRLRTGCRAMGIDYQQLRTDQPFDIALSNYLAARMGRVRG